MSKNYYEFLGVNKNATNEEIKKAFRTKSLVMHPDRGGNENDFKELNEAYQTLINDNQRREYDFKLENGNKPHHFHIPHHGMFNEFFSSMFSNINQQQQPLASRKLDSTIDHNPSMEELLKGEFVIRTTIINYNENNLCSFCNGEGVKIVNMNPFVRMQQNCPNCNGSCIINKDNDKNNKEETEIMYNIPIINLQNTIVLKDKGHKCKDKKGDLIVKLNFNDKIDRQGRLVLNMDVDWKEWLFGFKNRIVPLFSEFNMTLNTESLLGKTELEFAEKGIGCINQYFNNKGILLIKLINKPIENNKMEKLEEIIRKIEI